MWEKFKEEYVFNCKWFNVRKDTVKRPEGDLGDYFVMEKGASVFIIPIEFSFPENHIYLIKQFRYATQTWSWEIPAGSADGGDPLKAAKRELKEETGLHAEHWLNQGTYQVSPGLSDNIGHIFLASLLTQTNSNEQEEEGIIDCKKFTISEIKYMIKSRDITDGPTMAALCRSSLLWK